MNLEFTPDAWEDYLHWQSEDKAVYRKLNSLIRDILRDPGSRGIGKSERLGRDLQGFFSRHISGEHRLVYTFRGERLFITQCRFHY